MAAIAVLTVVALRSEVGQRVDQSLMVAVATSHDAPLSAATTSLGGAIGVSLAIAVVALLTALLRRDPAATAAVVAVFVGSNVTTQALKEAVVRPDLAGIGSLPNSFPSGHATLSVSAAAALAIALPRGAARLAALPALGFAGLIGVGVVAAAWHRPSDVLGAVLVVGGWAFATSAATGYARIASGRRRGRRSTRCL